VGDIKPENVNASLLQALLTQNVVPVFAPLTREGATLLNTNADTVTSALAIALSKFYDVRLIYCFEKPGILRDVNDNNSVINLLTQSYYQQLLAEGALHDGILPKLENAFSSIHAGVKEVLIGEHVQLLANTTAQVKGTLITLE
jgi:acetylglutamate kinase